MEMASPKSWHQRLMARLSHFLPVHPWRGSASRRGSNTPVATKRWAKIEDALKHNKDDKLVIKGYSLVQPNFAGIVVLAYQANTVGQLRGRRG